MRQMLFTIASAIAPANIRYGIDAISTTCATPIAVAVAMMPAGPHPVVSGIIAALMSPNPHRRTARVRLVRLPTPLLSFREPVTRNRF